MGKKTKPPPPRSPAPNRPPAATPAQVKPPTARQEPTPEQTERLKLASLEVEALTAEQGPAPLVGVSEQVGATLEESLKRVEGLLQDARAHFNKARERESAAKAEEDRLSTQKRAQEEALHAKRRHYDAELIGMKKATDDEVVAKLKAADEEISIKRKEWEQAELDLLQRLEGADGREQALTRRETTNRAKEAELVEQGYRLAEREFNAEQGFLTEKLRILRPVEAEVTRLREERDRLDGEIMELREKAETELRAKARARAERWAEEDAARTAAEAEARRMLDEAVALERQNKLHALRAELLTEREQAEGDWLEELSRRRTTLDKRASDLDSEHTRLVQVESRLRERQQELDTRFACLDEELAQAALDAQNKLTDDLAQREDAHEQLLQERGRALDAQAEGLRAQEKALKAKHTDLEVNLTILQDDREAFDRKLERLVAERTEDLRHDVTSLRTQIDDAREKRDAYFTELESRRELDRRFGGQTPDEILSTLTAAEKARDTLTQQLRERPDARASARLMELERERSSWLEDRASLHGDLAKAQGELSTRRLAAIELEALRKQKEALEVHKQLLDGAVDELRARVDELTRQEDHRNPMTALTSLDESEELQAEARTTTPLGRTTPTLKDFAIDLRHRIATGVEGRTLYYADRDVRAFLGGLAMTRLMLLQGISGTGKTSLPLAFANAVGGGIEIVEVQAGWRDRQDLVGYYNAFHRHYYATNFLQALYKAGTPAYRDRLFLMVLDEINLSRPEQFFADFLSALEQPVGERRLTLVNDPVSQAPRLMMEGRHLPIPPNVWFIGTANHDESTAEFADKTYDRAHVMEMPRKTEAAHFTVQQRGQRNPLSFDKLEAEFNRAAETQVEATKKATDWLRKAPFADDLQGRFRVGWGNRLEHQLARYLPVVVESGGSIGEAMDHLLVTKVLRKLKDRHDVRVAALEDLSSKLLTAWDKLDGANPPERCIELIEREIAAKKGEELE